METEMKPEFQKRLIASDETQITALQASVEKYAKKLQEVFNEAEKLNIKIHENGIIESLRTPEVHFSHELETSDLKTEKFVSLARGSWFEGKSVLPFLIISDKVRVNQEALNNFFDENYRFYLNSQDEADDYENTIQFGKLLASVKRYSQHKYCWLAIKNISPDIVEPLINTLK